MMLIQLNRAMSIGHNCHPHLQISSLSSGAVKLASTKMSKCGAGADHSQIHPTYMTLCSALANTEVKETSYMIGFQICGDVVSALNSLGYNLRQV